MSRALGVFHVPSWTWFGNGAHPDFSLSLLPVFLLVTMAFRTEGLGAPLCFFSFPVFRMGSGEPVLSWELLYP